ncbi:MAG: hypothetical protein ACYTE3_18660 [Planctomycetota bacterium]|jgi:hypothetical protein
MKKIAILASALTLTLLVAWGCRQDSERVTVAAAPARPSPEEASDVLTLSSSQLIFLDWDGPYASHAKVVSRRIVGDSGAEFKIHFPSNQPGNRSIEVVSSGAGGRGRLVGLDVSDYKTFALKFTLVSIDGTPARDTTQEFAVGALIGPTVEGRVSAYETVTLSGAPGRTTAISSTPVGKSKVYRIGIYARMVNPENWNPSGSTVTIRVEPIRNATIPTLP